MQGYGPPNAVGLKSSTTGHLLSPRSQWHIYRKPEHVHLGVVNRSCPWDGDTLSLLVVGSERAGDSSGYPSRYLVPAILESDCRLGQRMSPRRRKPGAGPDPKCPTENHPSTQAPKEPFVPDSSLPPSPSPSNKYSTTLGQSPPPIQRCDAVRRQHLQAGSLGRNAKYQHHVHSVPCRLQCRPEFNSCCLPPAVPPSGSPIQHS